MKNASVACVNVRPSVILGRKVRKYYKIYPDEWEIKSWGLKPRLEEATETIERVKIGEYDLPILNEKDEIYLSDKNAYATIQKVTSGTDGKIYYNVSYVVECVDELEKSKSDLQPELERLMALYEERIKEIEKEKEAKNNELQELQNKIKERKTWQENNPDAIKGIIIYELPKDQKTLSQEQLYYMYKNILNIPKEYIVTISPYKVTYIDKADKDLEFSVLNKPLQL